MNYCQKCGNPLGAQDKFCNRCGGSNVTTPQYQTPQYQQPYGQPQYNPVPRKPYKPAFWAIGLFNLIAAIVVFLFSNLLTTILYTIGLDTGAVLVNLVRGFVFTVIYILITCIGFAVYNRGCRRNGHPEKKLSILWVGIPWLLRSVFSFVLSFLWSLLITIFLNEMGMTGVAFGIVSQAWSVVSMLLVALLTWLLTVLILKAVVKGK